MIQPPLNFSSSEERSKWIIDHAEYFTVVRVKNRRYERDEHENLAKAEQAAKRIVDAEPNARVLIYAVCGTMDTYVSSPTRKES